jgi:magnesium-transporting ATPase (P-type)
VLEPRGRVVELEAPPRGFVGLSSIEVAARLARFGANEVSRDERFGTLRQLVGTLVSPLTLILLGATALAAFVGETTDAVIIAVTVLLGAALDALQTIRSHASLEHLQ